MRVCLTKDLPTASSLSIIIFTEDGSAQSIITVHEYLHNYMSHSIPDPDDYIGGSFDVLLGNAAGAISCQDISIVLGDTVQEQEDFSVVLNVTLEGAVAGEPNRATVTIRGRKVKHIVTSLQ